MFTFNHPRPVVSRKPVAELSVKHQITMIDTSDPTFFLLTQKRPLDVPKPNAPTLNFSVSYTLSEYLSFVREHGPVIARTVYAKRGKPFESLSPFQSALMQLAATIGFAFKKWRMKTCDFSINEAGLQRTTAGRTMLIPWQEVLEVYEYSQGFLVSKRTGTVPLPYRCFGAEQLAAFRELVSLWRAIPPSAALYLPTMAVER